MPAGDPVSWAILFERRRLGTALIARQGASSRKAAALGHVEQRRHHALDLVETSAADSAACGRVEMRDRAQEALGVGMTGPVEQILGARLLDLAAGIHHHD